MSALSRIILVTVCTGLLNACTQPAIKDQVSKEFASEDLYKVENSGFAEAYIRRDAMLSGYRSVDISPLEVSHIDIPTTASAATLMRDWKMTAERERALRTSWAEAMTRAFSGYTLANSGPGVLRISGELIRMAPGRPTATTIGGELQPAGSTRDVIEIWAEFRLYDASDGKLLAVIRDNRTLTSVAMSRTAPVTINLLFGSWAGLLHTRISGR